MFLTQVSKKCDERKEKVTLRNPEAPDVSDTISMSTDICQLCKKEDVEPAYAQTDTHVAMLVGDGHGGSVAAKKLSKSSEAILQTTLESGVDAAMQMCVELCRNTSSGAMVVISLYSIVERKLEVISMGDASCTVYQENAIIHEQPHHSRQNVDAGKGTCESSSGEQITWKEKAEELHINMPIEISGCMTPQPDRHTMMVTRRPEYFNWGTGVQIQACAFVGHTIIPRLPPCKKVIIIPEGPFHMVMSSDGVSDVMHAGDSVMLKHDVTAADIVTEAKKRWTTPFFDPTQQDMYKHLNEYDFNTGKDFFCINPEQSIKSTSARWKTGAAYYSCKSSRKNADGTYNVTFHDGDVRDNVPVDEMKFAEFNTGADDISVLVMTVE